MHKPWGQMVRDTGAGKSTLYKSTHTLSAERSEGRNWKPRLPSHHFSCHIKNA